MSPTLAPFLTVNPLRSSAGEPGVSAERQLHHAMERSIAQQDADWAERLLDRSGELGVAAAIRALWLPLANELSCDGSCIDEQGRLGPLLRQFIRNAMLSESDVPVKLWLVPMTLPDLSAAHLAALVLTRRGMGARVWPWWPMPAPGPFMMVGDGRGIPPDHDRITLNDDLHGWPMLSALTE